MSELPKNRQIDGAVVEREQWSLIKCENPTSHVF